MSAAKDGEMYVWLHEGKERLLRETGGFDVLTHQDRESEKEERGLAYKMLRQKKKNSI